MDRRGRANNQDSASAAFFCTVWTYTTPDAFSFPPPMIEHNRLILLYLVYRRLVYQLSNPASHFWHALLNYSLNEGYTRSLYRGQP